MTQEILHRLYAKHSDLWAVSTETHPFLVGCADGSVTTEQFNTWLVQDYLYVQAFRKFLANLVRIAPERYQPLIGGGENAVEAELAWFETRAEERGISRDSLRTAIPQETTARYQVYLASIVPDDSTGSPAEPERYVHQIAALYFIEDVYYKAWKRVQTVGGNSGPYSIFAEQWSNEGFCNYVEELKSASSAAIQAAADAGHDLSKIETALDELLNEVLTLEVKFWDMAFDTHKSALK